MAATPPAEPPTREGYDHNDRRGRIVGEVSRRLLYPRVVDEHESDTVLAQHLGKIRGEPATVTNLNSIPWSLGQAFQEVFEDAHPLDGEG
ncbi:MAG TPA: hypothetical protein VF068_10425, partial [Rubrobacter sp.]